MVLAYFALLPDYRHLLYVFDQHSIPNQEDAIQSPYIIPVVFWDQPLRRSKMLLELTNLRQGTVLYACAWRIH
jgi:hypothetical protein